MKVTKLTGVLGLCSVMLVGAPDISAAQDLAQSHEQQARTLAGDQFAYTADFLCVTSAERRSRYGFPVPLAQAKPVPATKVFDQLFFIGTSGANAWALKTSDGIVLIDALYDDAMAKDLIVPALVSMGMNPADVKYVIPLHGHFDHYGGASYFQRTYGSRVVMSGIDWDFMEGIGAPEPGPPPRPARDIAVTDGQSITLGDTTIKLYLAPGHTPGALLAILPVTQGGQPHKVAVLGGLAVGGIAYPSLYPPSLTKAKSLFASEGVDVPLTAHPIIDGTVARLERVRQSSAAQPNPFVLGQAGALRFVQVIEQCALANIARTAAAGGGQGARTQ